MPRFTGPLDEQFAGEAAASLGHAGRKLRKALDALRNHDATSHASQARTGKREELVATAGEAFWGFVVQREILGLLDCDHIAKEYGVPREVVRAMGPKRRRFQHE